MIRKNPTPESNNVIAYVTPTSPEKGKGDQVQAFTMSFTSYVNGRKIRRLLDNDTTNPQECTLSSPSLLHLNLLISSMTTRFEAKGF